MMGILKRIWGYVKSRSRTDYLYLLFALLFLYGISTLFTSGLSYVSFCLTILPIVSSVLLYYDRHWLAIFPWIVAFGVYIRIQNLPLLKGEIPLALDPHYFLRMTQEFVANGSLPTHDSMRYVPLGVDPTRELNMIVYTTSFLYNTLNIFIPITLEKTFILYPVIFFGLGLVAFYFFVREVFDDKIALLASFMLSVIPTYLHRTMAGFSDKESVAVFFMFLSLFLLARSTKIKDWPSLLIFSSLGGLSAGLMALSWGGMRFLITTVGLYYLVLFILGRMDDKEFARLASYTALFTIIVLLFASSRYRGLVGLMTSPDTMLVYAVVFLKLAEYVARTFLKKLHRPTTILISFGLLGIIAGSVIFGPDTILAKIIQIKDRLLFPLGTGRVTLTVAENRQPFFSDWWSSFGYFFVLFFAGSILLFRKLSEPLKEKRTLLLTIYSAFLTGFIFSRTSPSSILNGTNTISQVVYFGSLILFGLSILGLIIYSYHRYPHVYRRLAKIDRRYILILMFFLFTALGARGGMRLFFIFSPAIVILASFFVFETAKLVSGRDKFYKISAYVIVGLLLVPSLFGYTFGSINQARFSGPSFNAQWQNAMDWVQENTDEDSVFAHWWDYGYWVQTQGKRATILDGGNFIGYWNHLMGRHVLSGRSDKEALKFLYAHNATHLLIISDEIGKFTAYSSIGSDEEFDIFTWISTFVMVPQVTEKTGDITTYLFQGTTYLDQDLTYEGRFFPKFEAVIAGFRIPVKGDDDPETMELQQPRAIVVYRGSQAEVPVRCVYDEKKITFEREGLEGCLRIMPRFINQRYQQENGALLYVSKKGLDALWTRLFLFEEETENFELVYDDSGRYNLAYFNGRTMGPLKIWKINYPENFTISETLRQNYTARSTEYWVELNEKNKDRTPYGQVG